MGASPSTRVSSTLSSGFITALSSLRARIDPANEGRNAEDIVLVAAYVAWGAVRLRVAGMDLGSLVTTSAVITAVIAFAMQDTLGNVLGGLFLELDDSIAVGDWVRLDDLSGRVEDI